MLWRDFHASIPEDPTEVLANWKEIRQRIDDQFNEASTWDEWAGLHTLRDSVLRLVKPTIHPADQAKFQEAGEKIYDLLILQECMVGDHVCTETLDAVTRREIDAGRMNASHKLRQLAETGMLAPHLTHVQLLQAEVEKQGYVFESPPKGFRRILNWFRHS
jgi:hypothetical protein